MKKLVSIFALLCAASVSLFAQQRQGSFANGPYAKTKWEFLGTMDNNTFETFCTAFVLRVQLETDATAVPTNEFTRNDMATLEDAKNYLRANAGLENNGVYNVVLYKHYYSEEDKDGWFFYLKYSRREDGFRALVVRF